MDATCEEEEETVKLLKRIGRICGQEARNFAMGGIFISQTATGLAWLRKVALMVIVHQLLMESEKLLACNEDRAVALSMKSWPIGRTYVYGVGFTSGPLTVQQPVFEAKRARVMTVEHMQQTGQSTRQASKAALTIETILELYERGKLTEETMTRLKRLPETQTGQQVVSEPAKQVMPPVPEEARHKTDELAGLVPVRTYRFAATLSPELEQAYALYQQGHTSSRTLAAQMQIGKTKAAELLGALKARKLTG